MKFKLLSGLLMAVSAVFTHSTECTNDLTKYNTCIASIDAKLLTSEQGSDITTLCQKFSSDDCKTFIADVTSTKCGCDVKNSEEKTDALSILNMRIAYLKFCAKDTSGSVCPITGHLLEDYGVESGHSHGEHVSTFKDEEVEPRELTDWEGDWKSPYLLLLTGQLDPAFEAMSKKKGDKTADGYKDYYDKGYKSDISRVIIKGNRITFVYNDGKITSSEYENKGPLIHDWSSGTRAALYQFVAKDKNAGAPIYVEFNDHMIKPAKGEHFHLRSSSTSWDDIDLENNWPTFFPEDFSVEDIIADLSGAEHTHTETSAEHDHGKSVSTFKDEEVKDRQLSDWEGDWKSPYPLLLSGQLDEAFEIKAKEKGDKTATEYKDYYDKGYKSNIDRVIIKGNRITFAFNDGKIASSEYEHKGPFIVDWSSGTRGALYQFVAKDKNAGAPIYVEFNDHMIEPAKAAHFHLRSSNTSWDDIDLENNWPTFFPESSSVEDIVADLSGKAHDHDHEDHDHEHGDEDHEHQFYHDLMEDCEIAECNQRFLSLVQLLKLTENAEAKDWEEYVKYFEKKDCDALHELAEKSGSIASAKMTYTFIFTILFSIIYLF